MFDIFDIDVDGIVDCVPNLDNLESKISSDFEDEYKEKKNSKETEDINLDF